MGKASFEFKIGQKLYWNEMYSVPYMDKCKMCDGSGQIVNKINNAAMKCPKCNGKGEVDSGQGSIKQNVCEGVVGKINIEITKEDGSKYYDYEVEYYLNVGKSVDDYDDYLKKYEYQLFATKCDAESKQIKGCMGYMS